MLEMGNTNTFELVYNMMMSLFRGGSIIQWLLHTFSGGFLSCWDTSETRYVHKINCNSNLYNCTLRGRTVFNDPSELDK